MLKIKWAVLLSIFLLLNSCKSKNEPTVIEIEPKDKPNVVLILIDDLSHLGVSAYGANRVSSNRGLFKNVEYATPQIDKLADEGILFNNAHAYPLCEATRIALMSGKHNSRNFLRCKSQHKSDITFGDLFQKNGYATGIFGKWKQTRGSKEIHGKDYIYEFGWDEFTCFDVLTEGQRFINPNLVVNGQVMNYEGRTDLDPETGRRWYGPDICNRDALKFIDKNKDKPFFLYYPMLLVHDDHKPTPDTKPNSLFDNFDEANNNRNGHTGDDQRYFPDMVSYMDKLIGKVIDKLDEHNLRENTLVIVMGDNGTKESFTHVWPDDKVYPGRKGGTADNGTHVPLILNQPKQLPSGKQYNGLVDLTDIFPTICDAAGIEIPRKNELDGISFWKPLKEQKQSHRDVIYSWYNANSPYTNETELLKYAFNKDFKFYAPTEEFPNGRFFDLRTDPLERKGDFFKERLFGVLLYSGLNTNELTKTQEDAYKLLKNTIEVHKHVPVKSLKITGVKHELKVGEDMLLIHEITPKNATRNNIIWHSENPEIASIDKFGTVKAHKKGKVNIELYSWDDAFPVSANEPVTFKKDGIKDVFEINIE
ncbi:sulfatase-like hydrolase/transferase [Flavivirga eckloniae]|uniref:Sulfatase n=1 Tax=Flavivirga eckloniae TaxID=1803846 RepID=A0A2K9PM77_9FLAO|nr:sulfatase-like hydrolase/transferase [Flavivirga eckloniae]AUP78135.1 sulfatase [Flavivirga eckloniae]